MFPYGADGLQAERRRYDQNRGAVAELANAPVSKTGDSRFESWLPRLTTGDSSSPRRGMIRPWGSPPMCSSSSPASASATPRRPAGSGFRSSSRSHWRSGRVFIHGLDGAIVVRLIIALIVTALGVFVGMMIDARAEASADHPALRVGSPGQCPQSRASTAPSTSRSSGSRSSTSTSARPTRPRASSSRTSTTSRPSGTPRSPTPMRSRGMGSGPWSSRARCSSTATPRSASGWPTRPASR